MSANVNTYKSSQTGTNLFSTSNSLSIPTATETTSESLQTTSLILFNVQQLLTAGVPEGAIPHVLCGAVDGHGRSGALGECAAVGEGHELGEGIWTSGPTEEGSVSNLRR